MNKLIIFVAIGIYIIGIIITTVICAITDNEDDDFVDNMGLIILWPVGLVFGLIFLILFSPNLLYKSVRKHKKNKEQTNIYYSDMEDWYK